MLPATTTIGAARLLSAEQLIEGLGGYIKLGRFLRVRFVHNRRGFPDVPDDMTLGEFRERAALGMTKIIIDDEGGGGVKAKSPELVE